MSLSSSPSATLSFPDDYHRGSRSDSETILADGTSVEVTKNLTTALRTLRDHNVLSEGYHVWCNALRINQDDSIEYSREIGRMQIIYTRALETVIHLGHGDDAIESAMDFVNVTKDCQERRWTEPFSSTLRRRPLIYGSTWSNSQLCHMGGGSGSCKRWLLAPKRNPCTMAEPGSAPFRL
jgi:hypothetical protein